MLEWEKRVFINNKLNFVMMKSQENQEDQQKMSDIEQINFSINSNKLRITQEEAESLVAQYDDSLDSSEPPGKKFDPNNLIRAAAKLGRKDICKDLLSDKVANSFAVKYTDLGDYKKGSWDRKKHEFLSGIIQNINKGDDDLALGYLYCLTEQEEFLTGDFQSKYLNAPPIVIAAALGKEGVVRALLDNGDNVGRKVQNSYSDGFKDGDQNRKYAIAKGQTALKAVKSCGVASTDQISAIEERIFNATPETSVGGVSNVAGFLSKMFKGTAQYSKLNDGTGSER